MKQMKRGSRKKKAAAFIKIIFHVLIIAFFLGISAAFAYRAMLEQKKAREPISEYVSLTEEASAKAYVWLDQIEDMPLSYEDIKQMMGSLRLTVILTPTEVKGTYMQALDENSYEACRAQAREGFEKAYRETARSRILAAGHAEEISDEMMDDMMREAYGVSVSEYLDSCDVQLLPEKEALQAEYSGEVTHE